MKNLIEHWKQGLGYLCNQNVNSFYVFFTIIFAECIYLRIFLTPQTAASFTMILIGYIVNVLVCSYFKGLRMATRMEIVFTIIYSMFFAILFIIGCFINAKIIITITIIPLIITAITIVEIPCNTFYLLKLLIIVGLFALFTIAIVTLTTLPIVLKIIIPIFYAICGPFISYIEDDTAALNIFELAFDITWSKELEDFQKENSKY